MKIVNLGCGSKKLNGAINIDCDASLNPDKVMNLNKKWDFQDSSIDKIVSNCVIEHLHCELSFFVFECKRILKPNGEIKLITHNHFYWKHRIAYLFGVFRQKQGWHINHSFLIKSTELKNYFELSGFDVKLKKTGHFWERFSFISKDLFLQSTIIEGRLRP